MTKIAVVFLFTSFAVSAQSFQPAAWQQQMDQLKATLQRYQQQRSEQNRPHIEAQTGPVAGRPVSGKEIRRATQTLADGTVIDRGADVSSFYRDASGRMRDESPSRVEIFDTVGHFEYDMSPAKKTYTRSSLSGNENYIAVAVFGGTSYTNTSSGSRNNRPTTPPDSITEDLGSQMLNGVMTKRTRITITIPVGAVGNNREIKVTNERWYSDELQLLVKSVNNDPRFGVNEYELTDISQAEPDPALFTPPSDYTQVSRNH